MRQIITALAIYFGTSFLLHLAWELIQSQLFANLGTFAEHVPICLFATATGDMIFMAVIYLCLAVVHKNWQWLTDEKLFRHPATWVIPAILGILMAVSFELWAIYVVERWTYGSMPLIPVINVGLTPVLQMIIVPQLVLLAVFAAAKRATQSS